MELYVSGVLNFQPVSSPTFSRRAVLASWLFRPPSLTLPLAVHRVVPSAVGMCRRHPPSSSREEPSPLTQQAVRSYVRFCVQVPVFVSCLFIYKQNVILFVTTVTS